MTPHETAQQIWSCLFPYDHPVTDLAVELIKRAIENGRSTLWTEDRVKEALKKSDEWYMPQIKRYQQAVTDLAQRLELAQGRREWPSAEEVEEAEIKAWNSMDPHANARSIFRMGVAWVREWLSK